MNNYNNSNTKLNKSFNEKENGFFLSGNVKCKLWRIGFRKVQLETSWWPNRKYLSKQWVEQYIFTHIIDQVQGQDGWILAKFCFSVFMDWDEVGFCFKMYSWNSSTFSSVSLYSFSLTLPVFSFYPDREFTENHLYFHGKHSAGKNFSAPAWTSTKLYCGNKTGKPEQAVTLHLARSSSQSLRWICFTEWVI